MAKRTSSPRRVVTPDELTEEQSPADYGPNAYEAKELEHRRVTTRKSLKDARALLKSKIEEAVSTKSRKNLKQADNTSSLHYDKPTLLLNNTIHVRKEILTVISDFLHSLSTGKAATPSDDVARVELSHDAQAALAALWANDIARAEARLPLRTADTTEDTPHVPKQAATPSLPDFIPEADKYKPRQGIVEFLESGWPAPFVKANALSRPDFRRLDPEADMALRNWLRNPHNKLPSHLHIPTKAELNDRMLEGTDPEQLRHAARLHRAQSRRQTGIPTR